MAENLKNIATAKAKSLKTSPQKANIVLKVLGVKKLKMQLTFSLFQEKEYQMKY